MDSEERRVILGSTNCTFRWFLMLLCGGDSRGVGGFKDSDVGCWSLPRDTERTK